ncbi:MAG: hypothetical protein JW725_05065 [Candidatus Babeliaceae bacterium]|nr:hypothetical protein [Candidatus Babeliaceae bacterium]
MFTLSNYEKSGVQVFVSGTFSGDDIEPGTFHYLPPDMIQSPGIDFSNDADESSAEDRQDDESQPSACLI